MDIVWQGIVGGPATAFICGHPNAAICCPDSCRSRLAVLGGVAVWLVVALAIFLAPRYL